MSTPRLHRITACSVFNFLLFVFGCVIFLWVVKNGFIHDDETYQARMGFDYRSGPLAPLAFAISQGWTAVFGKTLIALRALAAAFGFAAGLTVCIFCWKLTRNKALTAWLWLLSAVLYKSQAFLLFNWDSASYFPCALSMCAAMAWWRAPQMRWVAVSGLAMALYTLFRLPSGIFLPLFWIMVLFHAPKRKRLKQIALSGAVFLLVFGIAIILLYRSPGEWLRALADNSVDGHSLNDLARIKYRFISLFRAALVLYWPGTGCVLLPLLFYRRLHDSTASGPHHNGLIRFVRESGWTASGAVIVWACVSACIIWHETETFTYFSVWGTGFPLTVGLLSAIPVKRYLSGGSFAVRSGSGMLWGVVAGVIAMCFGSDAFMERVVSFTTVPLCVAVLWQCGSEGGRRYAKAFVAVTLFVWGLSLGAETLRSARYRQPRYSSSMKQYKGLKDEQDLEYIAGTLKPAVTKLKSEGKTYLFLTSRMGMCALLGDDSGPGFHNFNFNVNHPSNWTPEIIESTRHIDAMLYIPSHPGAQSDSVISLLVANQGRRIIKQKDLWLLVNGNNQIPSNQKPAGVASI